MASVDIDALLNEGKKIFVKNTSRPMGHVVLTFVTPNGKSIPRNIPRTWIPICLTDSLSPEVIRQSSDLRLFIQKGVLKLMDPADAAALLKEVDAKEEQQRLNISDFSQQSTLTERVASMENQQTYSTGINTPGEEGLGQVADPVNSRVKSTLLQVEAKDLTEREAVAEFRIMQDEMSTHDLTYVISETKEEGPLRRFAYQRLSAAAAAIDSDVISGNEPAEDPAAVTEARKGQAIE